MSVPVSSLNKPPSTVKQDAAGWRAQLQLGFAHDGRRTILDRRQHQGPLVVQKPFYPEGDPCHVYLLHPPGGVVGGDRLRLEVDVAPAAHALITTPAAGKFYRSGGHTASLSQEFRVEAGGTLEWLPQETILFSGSDVSMSTTVRLGAEARFIGWELLCLGRPSSGEVYARGNCHQRLSLWRGETPLLIENARLAGGAPVLQQKWGLQHYAVTGTLLAVGVDRHLLQQVREQAPTVEHGLFSATLLDDVLVCRVLAQQAEPARRAFVSVWHGIREALLNRAACEPRIWST